MVLDGIPDYMHRGFCWMCRVLSLPHSFRFVRFVSVANAAVRAPSVRQTSRRPRPVWRTE
eukprot:11944222-Alexandrium_andersonii.AAC.1